MNKAFFINGGAGRVLCSIPALERYAETHDDFIIVSESWSELYLNSKILRDHVFPIGHKDLFTDQLKDKKIISPEPYRVNQYFNQKCNLIQAFDIEINELDEVRETGKINIELNKEDQVNGHLIAGNVRETKGKNKIIVFQPFGQSAKVEGQFIYDSSGRSFEIANIFKLIQELNKDFGVILMSTIQIPGWESLGIACPQGMGLNGWMGVINSADYFLGCDSVGQHMAYSLNTPATVVIGSTFPENISYPDSKKFTIIDNGKGNRKYSPIRLTMDITGDRDNEDLMVLDDSTMKSIVKGIKNSIGISKKDLKDTLGVKKIDLKESNPTWGNRAPIPTFGDSKKSILPPSNSKAFTPKTKKKKKPIDELLEIESNKS
tara:strand:- start:1727 stop:2854 length:1128 start_codon:yes stop_codon:yes gene_type:complete